MLPNIWWKFTIKHVDTANESSLYRRLHKLGYNWLSIHHELAAIQGGCPICQSDFEGKKKKKTHADKYLLEELCQKPMEKLIGSRGKLLDTLQREAHASREVWQENLRGV